MTQEDNQLALQDLCARLPYGVIGRYSWKGNEPYNRELTGSLFDELKSSWYSTEDSEFLPYLRPISSMTEEEKKEYHKTFRAEPYGSGSGWVYVESIHSFDWLNKKMFDYRKLASKGRAIEVTKEELDDLRWQLYPL